MDKASRAIRRSQLPILEQALIRFSGDRCLLAGTDLESWITVEIPAQGDEFAFAFKRTKDIRKICRLFDGELSFECAQADREDDVTVTLTCGPRKGAFAAYPAADFPEMPSPEGDVLFSADTDNLLRRIERVDYATMDPSKCAKPACSSVHFRGNDVFTIDGNRVACDADASLDFPTPFLAPVRAMRHSRQHHTIPRARLGGAFAPQFRCKILKYTKYSCDFAPCCAVKSLANPYTLNYAVLP